MTIEHAFGEEEEKAFNSQEFYSHQYDVDLLLIYKQIQE